MRDISSPQRQTAVNNPIEDFRQTQKNYSRWSGLAFPDVTLMTAIILLMIIGWVFVSSASMPLGHAEKEWIFHYSFRQGVFMIIALIAGFATYCLPTQFINRLAPLILLLGFSLLVLVLVPGVAREINGAIRWIRIGPVNVQVSEFVRISVMVFTASFLCKNQNRLHKSIVPMLQLLGILSIVAILLYFEPDFGSIVVISATVLGMTFLAGVCSVRFFGCAGAIVAAGAYAAQLAPYRVKRLTSFWDPWDDVYDTDYQLVNSLIAIGRGEVTGVGIGESLEKHQYLPEAHTDFIFSILAEETGLIGVTILMFIFGVVVWRSFKIANNADKARMRFESCLAYGIGLWIGMQVLINISVATGLLPTKGLTLPLISYGGSSVVACTILFALLLRIDSQSRYILRHEDAVRKGNG